jgi:hypothetical protein
MAFCLSGPLRELRLPDRDATTFLNRERGEGLDSSDSPKNHGTQPGEKDDIDEKPFHTIFIGLFMP